LKINHFHLRTPLKLHLSRIPRILWTCCGSNPWKNNIGNCCLSICIAIISFITWSSLSLVNAGVFSEDELTVTLFSIISQSFLVFRIVFILIFQKLYAFPLKIGIIWCVKQVISLFVLSTVKLWYHVRKILFLLNQGTTRVYLQKRKNDVLCFLKGKT